MERLTRKTNQALQEYDIQYLTTNKDYFEILNKLGHFEDMEDELKKVYGECNGLLETAIKSLVKHEGADIGQPNKSRLLTDEDVEKWDIYKRLEEKDIPLPLLTRIGETAYQIKKVLECEYDYNCDEIDAYKCECDTNCEHEYMVMKILETKFQLLMLPLVGKTVFFTKEEAENSLKK